MIVTAPPAVEALCVGLNAVRTTPDFGFAKRRAWRIANKNNRQGSVCFFPLIASGEDLWPRPCVAGHQGGKGGFRGIWRGGLDKPRRGFLFIYLGLSFIYFGLKAVYPATCGGIIAPILTRRAGTCTRSVRFAGHECPRALRNLSGSPNG